MSLDLSLAQAEFAYLTTTGRVTGDPHEIEIWFALQGNTAYLMNGDSKYDAGKADWVRNLLKQPSVSLRIDDQTFEASARIVTEANEDVLARRLLLAKYATTEKPLETWGRVAVPVAIDLHR
ncbi:MAG TPA: nitroreductase/quinone reductase family protein [Dehalococcoidia bacterium]|nr:nitroreductase/quinone reductase family protein [Dehalococcoidia bacterium]